MRISEYLDPAESESHRHREVAESFGSDAERYDRARPRYPEALVHRIVAASPDTDDQDVLDVGCGTGIAARQFQAAGSRVLGVEPDERMAALARRSGTDVEVTTLEAWNPAGRQFDAVVAAHAWHWIDPVAGAAKVARVLRPGGRLTVFWNAFQAPPELDKAFTAVFHRVLPETPGLRRGLPGLDAFLQMCDTAEDGIRQTGAFNDPERWRFDWAHHYTRDEWLDQLPTFANNNQLPPPTLAQLLAGVGSAIDAAGGTFTMPYTTLAVTATRTDTATRTHT